jgi:hypothetical protein
VKATTKFAETLTPATARVRNSECRRGSSTALVDMPPPQSVSYVTGPRVYGRAKRL